MDDRPDDRALAWSYRRRVDVGVGEIGLAGDDAIGVDMSCQEDEVVVIGVA